MKKLWYKFVSLFTMICHGCEDSCFVAHHSKPMLVNEDPDYFCHVCGARGAHSIGRIFRFRYWWPFRIYSRWIRKRRYSQELANIKMFDMFGGEIDAPHFRPIKPDSDHMLVSVWLKTVECGGFIDYDGFGHLATADRVSNAAIYPSQADDYNFPEWATHIVWYNR